MVGDSYLISQSLPLFLSLLPPLSFLLHLLVFLLLPHRQPTYLASEQRGRNHDTRTVLQSRAAATAIYHPTGRSVKLCNRTPDLYELTLFPGLEPGTSRPTGVVLDSLARTRARFLGIPSAWGIYKDTCVRAPHQPLI